METDPVNFRQLIYEITEWTNTNHTGSILSVLGPDREKQFKQFKMQFIRRLQNTTVIESVNSLNFDKIHKIVQIFEYIRGLERIMNTSLSDILIEKIFTNLYRTVIKKNYKLEDIHRTLANIVRKNLDLGESTTDDQCVWIFMQNNVNTETSNEKISKKAIVESNNVDNFVRAEEQNNKESFQVLDRERIESSNFLGKVQSQFGIKGYTDMSDINAAIEKGDIVIVSGDIRNKEISDMENTEKEMRNKERELEETLSKMEIIRSELEETKRRNKINMADSDRIMNQIEKQNERLTRLVENYVNSKEINGTQNSNQVQEEEMNAVLAEMNRALGQMQSEIKQLSKDNAELRNQQNVTVQNSTRKENLNVQDDIKQTAENTINALSGQFDKQSKRLANSVERGMEMLGDLVKKVLDLNNRATDTNIPITEDRVKEVVNNMIQSRSQDNNVQLFTDTLKQILRDRNFQPGDAGNAALNNAVKEQQILEAIKNLENTISTIQQTPNITTDQVKQILDINAPEIERLRVENRRMQEENKALQRKYDKAISKASYYAGRNEVIEEMYQEMRNSRPAITNGQYQNRQYLPQIGYNNNVQQIGYNNVPQIGYNNVPQIGYNNAPQIEYQQNNYPQLEYNTGNMQIVQNNGYDNYQNVQYGQDGQMIMYNGNNNMVNMNQVGNYQQMQMQMITNQNLQKQIQELQSELNERQDELMKSQEKAKQLESTIEVGRMQLNTLQEGNTELKQYISNQEFRHQKERTALSETYKESIEEGTKAIRRNAEVDTLLKLRKKGLLDDKATLVALDALEDEGSIEVQKETDVKSIKPTISERKEAGKVQKKSATVTKNIKSNSTHVIIEEVDTGNINATHKETKPID